MTPIAPSAYVGAVGVRKRRNTFGPATVSTGEPRRHRYNAAATRVRHRPPFFCASPENTVTSVETKPIASTDELLGPFEQAFKPDSAFVVGTEAEKFGLRMGPPASALAFDGPEGVQGILAALHEGFGWQPQREHADGEIISLRRDGASITLEPAAQLELSGAPLPSIHDTAREFASHVDELRRVSEPLGISWVSLGFHPFARHADLPHVPKLRYAIMRRYMPTRGRRSEDMMRRTCTVQANLDYRDSADAMRKLRLSLQLQPIATAMFANSPFFEGRRGRHLSERAATWLEMDVDRSGIPEFALQPGATLEHYVQWALDVPMFMIKRGSRVLDNAGQTFRSFMRDGFEGETATHDDWDTHLNTLFPEARLKRTLEVRGADALPSDLVCAVPALWKGIFYDAAAFDAAEALAEPLNHAQLEAARPAIASAGLAAELAGRPLQSWAEALLDIAISGLRRRPLLDSDGRDESRYLQGMVDLVAQGRTPAEDLLQRAAPEDAAPDLEALLRAATI